MKEGRKTKMRTCHSIPQFHLSLNGCVCVWVYACLWVCVWVCEFIQCVHTCVCLFEFVNVYSAFIHVFLCVCVCVCVGACVCGYRSLHGCLWDWYYPSSGSVIHGPRSAAVPRIPPSCPPVFQEPQRHTADFPHVRPAERHKCAPELLKKKSHFAPITTLPIPAQTSLKVQLRNNFHKPHIFTCCF